MTIDLLRVAPFLEASATPRCHHVAWHRAYASSIADAGRSATRLLCKPS